MQFLIIKKCTKCFVSKPLPEFTKQLKGLYGVSSWRRECMKFYRLQHKERCVAYTKLWRSNNRDKWKEQTKRAYDKHRDKKLAYGAKWREGNKERRFDKYLQRRFRIDLKKYNEMLLAQDFKCGICPKKASDAGRRFAVDHCHSTGKIRGLLCGKCNRALGLFDDSVTTINKAAEYLKNAS